MPFIYAKYFGNHYIQLGRLQSLLCLSFTQSFWQLLFGTRHIAVSVFIYLPFIYGNCFGSHYLEPVIINSLLCHSLEQTYLAAIIWKQAYMQSLLHHTFKRAFLATIILNHAYRSPYYAIHFRKIFGKPYLEPGISQSLLHHLSKHFWKALFWNQAYWNSCFAIHFHEFSWQPLFGKRHISFPALPFINAKFFGNHYLEPGISSLFSFFS